MWSLPQSIDFHARRRTPVVLQGEAAECGLACVAMVAATHGHAGDLAALRSRHSVSLAGANLLHLVQVAQSLGLAARGLKVELAELGKLALPAVLHWGFDHFVVLVELRRRHAVVHDPGQGRRRLALAQLSRQFTGVALELTPTDAFERGGPPPRAGLARLLGRLPGLGGAIGRIVALAAALEVLAVASPLFVQLVVDQALVGNDRDLLAVLAAGFLLLATAQVGIAALRGWALVVLGTTMNLALARRLFGKLLKLPIAFFERRHLGDIVSRFDSMAAVQRTFTGGALEAIADGLMALVTLALMFWYSPALAAVVLGAVLACTALRLAGVRPLRDAAQEQIARQAASQSNLIETVRGVGSVKLFNRQAQRGALFHNLLVGQFNAGVRLQRLQLVQRALAGLIFGAENVAVIWLGALAALGGGFSVGMLLAFIAYKQQFIARASSLIDRAIELRLLGLHLDRIGEVVLAPPERDEGADAPAGIRGAIELKGVGFRYAEHDAPVLEGVNLRIAAGESVAIVGPSGCGKTTLAKILLGLLEPTEGEVLIDGMSLARIGLAAWRERVGAVMQDDALFAGSIADNIGFFDPNPDRGRIEACARMAAVHADIVAMAMGYDTLVGDMGSVLSGGQKQRVLLARALYRTPSLLVLDEATSHLDLRCEHEVNQAIARLEITRIVIAHRPETIASCERVFALGAHP